MVNHDTLAAPVFTALLKQREKETYNYNHPSLMLSKDKFFSGDQVNYIWNHDSIHAAVAMGPAPVYTLFQKDGEDVAVDKNKFFALDYEQQLHSVCEEAAVLAIERSLVPHPGAMEPKQAWMYALSKVCSSITSGWWREFAYENILRAIHLYPVDYYDKFKRGINTGLVKSVVL